MSFVLLTGLLDLISTFFPFSFSILEANPIFIFGNSLVIMVILKLLILTWVCFELNRVTQYKRFYQYFWIYFSIMLIVAQGYACYNNYQAKEQITKELGYNNAYDVPVSEIEQYKGTNTQSLWAYFSIVFLIAYLPAFMAFISFKFWEIICCDDAPKNTIQIKLHKDDCYDYDEKEKVN
jgi:hypothetical protein